MVFISLSGGFEIDIGEVGFMKPDIQDITERALKLLPGARAYIAETLLESLDFEADFPISKEWIAEIRKRCREIDKGKTKLVPGEEALSCLHKKYP